MTSLKPEKRRRRKRGNRKIGDKSQGNATTTTGCMEMNKNIDPQILGSLLFPGPAHFRRSRFYLCYFPPSSHSASKTSEEKNAPNGNEIVFIWLLFFPPTELWKKKTSQSVSRADARPTLSQLWNFKIRRTTLLNYIKFADFLISRLQNCVRAGLVDRRGEKTDGEKSYDTLLGTFIFGRLNFRGSEKKSSGVDDRKAVS